MEGAKLKTSVSDLDLEGSLSLKEGSGGGYAASLNTASDRIRFATKGALSKTDSCSVGFSVKFYVKFLSFCDNMYVLTTGGDLSDSAGLAVYYRHRSIHVTVSTSTTLWTVATSLPKIRRFHDYRISWSRSLGLQVDVDGSAMAMTTSFYRRREPGTKTHPLVIGGPVGAAAGCDGVFVFGGLEIFTAPTLVLTALNVITGKWWSTWSVSIGLIFFRNLYNY